MKRKICIVTGTRAEYGLLRPVIEGVRDRPELELQLFGLSGRQPVKSWNWGLRN